MFFKLAKFQYFQIKASGDVGRQSWRHIQHAIGNWEEYIFLFGLSFCLVKIHFSFEQAVI
jgi:hypothetical protein